MNPTIRYWIQLQKHSEPMETDNEYVVKNEMKRGPTSRYIMEYIYPNTHKFIFGGSVKEETTKSLTDAERSNTVVRLFNKIDQYHGQVMRKKHSSAKPKRK